MSAADNMRWFLKLRRLHGDAIEADLQHYYGIDYRDRDRFDEFGERKLPMRRLWVLIHHLPADSAVAAIDRDGPLWTLEAHLLDDVRMWLMLLAGAKAKEVKPHPQRPIPAKHVDPARMKKIIDARKRLHERQRAIAAGEIT